MLAPSARSRALAVSALTAGLVAVGAVAADATPVTGATAPGAVTVGEVEVVVADDLVEGRAAAAARASRAALRASVAAADTDAAALQATAAGDAGTLGMTAVSPSSAPARIEALQTRLTYAGTTVPVSGEYDARTVAAVKHFQEKHRLPQTGTADARTVATVQRVTKRGAQLDPRCSVTGPAICIDKSQKVLRYVHNGRTLTTMDANFGPEKGQKEFGRYSVTREGSFRIYKKAVHHVSTGYGTPMPYAMWFDGAEAIHHSEYFRAAGYANSSQGCATTRDLATLRWVFAHTPVGTPAIVHR